MKRDTKHERKDVRMKVRRMPHKDEIWSKMQARRNAKIKVKT